MADVRGLEPLDQPRDEAVVDARGHDEPARGGAALARREVGALQRAVDRDLEVGVVEDDQRVLAAHLELHANPALRAGHGDAAARLDRPGEGDRVDAVGLDERVADLPARPEDESEHALGHPGPNEHVDERPGRCGHERAGLRITALP